MTLPAVISDPDRRGADHLCGLGDDPGPRHHRRRREAHPARSKDAAEDRDLRPRADLHAAGRGLGTVRDERDRTLRRGALRPGRQSAHLPGRRGGHPGAGGEPARGGARARACRRPRRGAVRRLARRHGAGCGRHGAALQALPHSWRQLRSHAEVHTIILPHATAYNRAGAPAAMARIARARARGRGGGACSTSPPRSAPGRAWPRSACAHQISSAPPTSPSRAPTRTRPRSSAGCSTTRFHGRRPAA